MQASDRELTDKKQVLLATWVPTWPNMLIMFMLMYEDEDLFFFFFLLVCE